MKVNKRIICLLPFQETWLDIVNILNKKAGWEPSMWVGGRTALLTEARVRYKDLLFYDHHDLRCGAPPKELPSMSLPPLDAAILEKLSSNETIIYEMISRNTLGKRHFTYNEYKRLYHNDLRIWMGILRELNADIVVSGSIPHRIYDYILYLLCQEMGIPYLMIEQTNLPHLAYGISSITDRSRAIRNEYNNIQGDFVLSPQTIEYLKKTRSSYEYAMPSYFTDKVLKEKNKLMIRKIYDSLSYNLQTAAAILKNAVQGKLSEETEILYFKVPNRLRSDHPERASLFQFKLLERKVNIEVERAKNLYLSNTVKPDLSRPYIYFAASYQAERSTCPDSGIYYDLSLVAEVLSKSIPYGWKIYYKEHPTSFRFPLRHDNIRDTRLYYRLKKVPNCILVDPEVNSFSLIDNSQATVVSGSGTSAWEAVVRGIPALEFGDYWYSSCPGIFKVNSLEECKAAIDKIDKGFKPAEDEVAKYIAAAENLCEDLSFRQLKDAPFKEIERSRPIEYKKRINSLAKVLIDEYKRITQ